MTKLNNKDREQMKNMLKQRWLKPNKPIVKRYKNKKPIIPERTPRKLIRDLPITTQTVLIKLTNSGTIPMAVMEYVVNDKDIIIDKNARLALIEIRLTQQDTPRIPAHVRRNLVEEAELEDKEAIKKEFKGINYLDDKLDKPFKYSSNIDIKPIEEIVENLAEELAQETIETPVEEIVVVPNKPKMPKHVQKYIDKEVEKENIVLTTISQPTFKKSDKITIPIISFSIWRIAIKFTIEFRR